MSDATTIYVRNGAEIPGRDARGGDMACVLEPKIHDDGAIYAVDWMIYRAGEIFEKGRGWVLALEDEPEASGYTKWDGCVNWSVAGHSCGEEDMAALCQVLMRVHDFCRPLMPLADWSGGAG